MNEAEEFRKVLMQQAYEDFIDWAWKFQPIRQEFMDDTGRIPEGYPAHFVSWVTKVYWGDVD